MTSPPMQRRHQIQDAVVGGDGGVIGRHGAPAFLPIERRTHRVAPQSIEDDLAFRRREHTYRRKIAVVFEQGPLVSHRMPGY